MMRTRSRFTFRFALLLLALWAPLSWSGAGNQAFDRGVSAFKAGRYGQALQYFQQAQETGNTSEQLQYNLGATYYRLARYPEARTVFEELTRDSRYAALAHYNLGLVARKTGNESQAAEEFRIAQRMAVSPKLQKLAAAQLRRLSGEPDTGASWFSGFFSLGAGYNDNVALASDIGLVSPSNSGSSFFTLLASGNAQLTGNSRNGLQLTGLYLNESYSNLKQYDFSYQRVGPQYRYSTGDLSTTVGIYAGSLTLGGKTFETFGTLSLETEYNISGNQELAAEYQYDDISGSTGYDYVTGWRQSLELKYTWSPGAGSFSAGYGLELNEREGLVRGPEFFSASPTRNSVFATAGLPISAHTDFNVELEYERSNYNEANQMLQGGTLISIERQDTRWSGEVGLSYEMTAHWNAVLEYRYLRKQSNIETHGYTSQRFAVRIEYLFF